MWKVWVLLTELGCLYVLFRHPEALDSAQHVCIHQRSLENVCQICWEIFSILVQNPGKSWEGYPKSLGSTKGRCTHALWYCEWGGAFWRSVTKWNGNYCIDVCVPNVRVIFEGNRFSRFGLIKLYSLLLHLSLIPFETPKQSHCVYPG